LPGVPVLTVNRIENGMPSRISTRRKILFALGLELSDKDKVFGDKFRLYFAARSCIDLERERL
jgi:hypothetical protein